MRRSDEEEEKTAKMTEISKPDHLGSNDLSFFPLTRNDGQQNTLYIVGNEKNWIETTCSVPFFFREEMRSEFLRLPCNAALVCTSSSPSSSFALAESLYWLQTWHARPATVVPSCHSFFFLGSRNVYPLYLFISMLVSCQIIS